MAETLFRTKLAPHSNIIRYSVSDISTREVFYCCQFNTVPCRVCAENVAGAAFAQSVDRVTKVARHACFTVESLNTFIFRNIKVTGGN